MTFLHQSVLLAEVVEAFSATPPGLLVDATVGGAGHSRALLEARPDCRLLGIDRDTDALHAAREALAAFGPRAEIIQATFSDLGEVLGRQDLPVVGVLFDLGVSSPQLDRPDRGFSYRADAPLDMRMDRSQGKSAWEVVNTYEEGELASVIARLGEERFARAIARRIVARRPLDTTTQLAEVVRDAIPAATRRTGPHPARRTFQAIRMEVNGELDQLADGLDGAFAALAPGGRLAAISYHSLEDRIVKHRFSDWTSEMPTPRGLPLPPDTPPPPARLVMRRAVRPSAAEVAANRRAESARLRVLERRGDLS